MFLAIPLIPWACAEPDTFNHFPLTGAHQTLTCTDCHGAEIVAMSGACVSCHSAPPDHFPGACSQCHNTTDWANAIVNHDFFPQRHGGAKGRCETCHVNDDDYATFSCTDCHEHRKSKMDDEHRGNNRYRYDSVACLNCHPGGQE